MLCLRGGPAANKQRSPLLPGPSPPPPPTLRMPACAPPPPGSWDLRSPTPGLYPLALRPGWPERAGLAGHCRALRGTRGKATQGPTGYAQLLSQTCPQPVSAAEGQVSAASRPQVGRLVRYSVCTRTPSLPGGVSDWKPAGQIGDKLQHPQGLKSSTVLCPSLGNARRKAVPSPKLRGASPAVDCLLALFLLLLLLIISPGFDFYFRTGKLFLVFLP